MRSAAASHVIDAARARPAADSSALRRSASSESFGDRVDVERVDEDGGAAGGFLGRRAGARHDGRALDHRLHHGQAEALRLAGIGEHGRRGVQRRQLGGRHEAEEAHVAVDAHRGVTPTLRPGDDERFAQLAGRFGEAAEVLARLERADEEHEPVGEPEPLAHRGDVVARRRSVVDAERDDADPRRLDVVGLEVAAAGLARRDHHRRTVACHVEAAAHHPQALPAEARRVVEERQVVHRDDQRRRRRAGDETGGVGQVDAARDLLDAGAAQAQPRLVEERPGQRELGDRDGRPPRRRRCGAVAAGDADERDVAPRGEPAGDLDRRHGGAAGRVVPALLEGVGDAHAAHDGGSSRRVTACPSRSPIAACSSREVPGSSVDVSSPGSGRRAPTSSHPAAPSTT